MKVTHRTTIVCKCPANAQSDVYDVVFETERLVLVEDIQRAIDSAISEPVYQEALTITLAGYTKCKVTTRGRHGRFETECCCE